MTDEMYPEPTLGETLDLGDFCALLEQLDKPCDKVAINGGYATLLARIGSAEFRRRNGIASN